MSMTWINTAMTSRTVILWTCLVVTCLCVNDDTSRLNPQQANLMKHAMKSLLGFKDVPGQHDSPSSSSSSSSSTRVEDSWPAPRYMLELYERYKHGGGIKSAGSTTANTVRSIQAEIGMVNGNSMFIFNLTSITTSEKVLSSELHVYKKKVSKSRRKEFHLRLHELTPSALSDLGSRMLSARSHGWQAAEVTGPVRSCLINQPPHRVSLLAVSVLTPREDGRLGHANLSRVAAHLSRPFLVVFSKDSQNISVDHIDPRLTLADLHQTFVQPESGLKDTYVDQQVGPEQLNNAPVALSDTEHDFHLDDVKEGRRSLISEVDPQDLDEGQHSDGLVLRQRRDISDNEIPELHADYNGQGVPMKFNVPHTHPGILQGRPHGRHSAGSVPSQTDEPRRKHQPRTNSRLIPYPDDYEDDRRRQKKRRKDRRRRRKKEKKVLPLGEWKGESRERERERENAEPLHRERLCGKRRLVVDFADIGWSEWIISPKSFEAYYCAGQCPFPLAQRLRPSNHATIQSLVHAIGMKTDVPAPCCVPETMSSVTLLYFDAEHNVVLKNYPEMSVSTCACR